MEEERNSCSVEGIPTMGGIEKVVFLYRIHPFTVKFESIACSYHIYSQITTQICNSPILGFFFLISMARKSAIIIQLVEIYIIEWVHYSRQLPEIGWKLVSNGRFDGPAS